MCIVKYKQKTIVFNILSVCLCHIQLVHCVYFCITKHNFLYNAMFIIIKTYVDTSGFLR